MRKNIVYEDEYIIVVYKPPGIATQTSRYSQRDMVSEVKNYLAAKKENKGKGEPYLGLVHRLDQPVSGILAFGKTKEAAAGLSRQIADGTFHKYYFCVIYGKPAAESGRLENYLYKDGKTNMSSVVDKDFPDAKEAVLLYSHVQTLMVLEAMQEVSLMQIELLTGRHHQIRVQMAQAGMPLMGDSKYGTEESRELSREIGCKNVALCAHRLEFRHPVTGERIGCTKVPEGEIFEPFFGNLI